MCLSDKRIILNGLQYGVFVLILVFLLIVPDKGEMIVVPKGVEHKPFVKKNAV